ncbi:hypothetical protein ACG9XL_17020 [Acinetobacter nosocomialis]|uniref:hypothetical protein n=1 Tax=Acinetobacter calcoaceticus/baumannii complex TaxID=909768 RepID=UPI00233F5879|nr:hypothetical protein [Acinetobacter baumannii]MDC5567248.1 hypothetical protein [Acinetobacter baumannii]MDK2172888.1 hypothetical protein [Acinetobacter baumannii]MDK2183660.1 hypothetical protein [Acinetobacter baumannii]MDK2329484.1 hypothetical protein [Acinetobacter baumannii]
MSSNFRKFPSIPLEALTAMRELRAQLLGPSRIEKLREYYLEEFKFEEIKPKFRPGQWVMFIKASGIEEGPYTIFEAYQPHRHKDYLYVIGKVKSKLELTATFERLRLMTQTEIAEYVAKSSTSTFGIDLM